MPVLGQSVSKHVVYPCQNADAFPSISNDRELVGVFANAVPDSKNTWTGSYTFQHAACVTGLVYESEL